LLLPYGDRLERIIVSGPGFTPEDFLKKEYLDYRLRAKLSQVIGIEYAGTEGIYQTLGRIREPF
jgi:peptide subunit release factor 1 (eRF1)